MFTLNLANPKNSNIAFLISNYPDGQQDLRILDVFEQNKLREESIVVSGETSFLYSNFKDKNVTIKSRFNSVADLNLIKVAVACLRRLKVNKIDLYIPYLLGARADRKFAIGGCSYMVDVISPDLRALNFDTITVIDVHSEVSPACLPNLENISVLARLTKFALEDIKAEGKTHCKIYSPDSGASKRTFETCKELVVEYANVFDVVECAKHRDMLTGKILETIVPVSDLNQESGVIVDDICSKGGTFMGLSTKIKEKNGGDEYLVVTHFEGTADLNALKASGIKKVYTTNSIGNFETPDGFIKQIDVFE